MARFHLRYKRRYRDAMGVSARGLGVAAAIMLCAGCSDSSSGGQEMPKAAPELAQVAPSKSRAMKLGPRAGMPIRSRADYERLQQKAQKAE